MIRLVIADDHTLVRAGLRELLDSIDDFTVVAEAATGEEAVQAAREHQPDVVLMDIDMPGMSGFEATRRIVRVSPGVRVIGVSEHRDGPYPMHMLDAGAIGYVSKSGERREARWYQRFQAVFGGLTRRYNSGVRWVLRKLALVGLMYIGIAVALGLGVVSTPTGFVPPEDQGALFINLQLPDASSLSRTKAAMDKVVDLLSEDDRIETVTAITGYSILSGAMQSNGGTLFVVLKHWDQRPAREDLVFFVARSTRPRSPGVQRHHR